MIRDYFLKIFCFILFGFFSLYAQTKELHLDSLSLKYATVIALKYYPAIKAAAANYDVANSNLRLSRSIYFPQINVTGSASRTDGAFVFNPSFPPRQQQYNNYTAGIAVQQTLFDFGRTNNSVSANEQFLNASGYDLKATKENVIMNVQINYYSYLESRYIEKVNEETLMQAEEHLKIAKAFYKVGSRPQYDVTSAEVEVANANLNLIRAKNQVKITRLQLNNSMGVYIPEEYVITDSLNAVIENISLDSSKAIAVSNRSELKSSYLALSANKSLISAAWDQNLPFLSAYGNYNWSGFNLPLYSRWTAGINFTLPIFQGFYVDAQVQKAEANVEQAEANVEALKQSILLDVEQNFLSLVEAENRIDAAKQLVVQAEENFNLATGRYKSGVGSATEISDAQLALSNAKTTNIQAAYDYLTALIRLKKSMGTITNGVE